MANFWSFIAIRHSVTKLFVCVDLLETTLPQDGWSTLQLYDICASSNVVGSDHGVATTAKWYRSSDWTASIIVLFRRLYFAVQRTQQSPDLNIKLSLLQLDIKKN